MIPYLIRRLWQSVIVVFGVVTVVFFVLQLTGDPVRIMLGETASEEDIQNVKRQMGLDRPIYEQYVSFLVKAGRGDFGESIRQRGQPAMAIVLSRYPATIKLAFLALATSVLLATILGVISAIKRYTWIDSVVMFLALIGQSVPNFWLGIMLVLIVAVQFGWLPSQGAGDGGLRYLILPMLTLAAPGLARLTRLVRSGMLDILGHDYIRTARAKGLHESRVVFGHALKNAAIPLVTVIGLDMGALLGGAVVTEQIFAWPGVGLEVIIAINGRDFPVVQAAVFVVAVSFVLINLVVDLAYTWLDPRVRLV
ncbi:MAG: ABC transporter permease [Chloroflexi bacterium]|nr:ABC transporter permease [Chloroflexota bacterium]